MIYYAAVQNALVNQVQSALVTAYGAALESASPVLNTQPHTSEVLEIVLSDDSITSDQVSATITNATGQYTAIGTRSGFSNGPNMGAFLNSIGEGIRQALRDFKICDFLQSTFGVDVCDYWWLPFVILALLAVAVTFFVQSSKGFGEGLATRKRSR